MIDTKDRSKIKLLAIGGSAGSLPVVLKILPLLKKAMNFAVVVVLHRKSSDDTSLLNLLTDRTEFIVKEAEEKEQMQPGVIYLAPANYHLLIEKDETFSLDDSEKVNFSRPSIDVTFESASEVLSDKLACLLLSGSNADGVAGLIKAKASHSLVFIQDPASAEVPFMPKLATERVAFDLLIKDDNIQELVRFLAR
jgi:two-component system chemotaxis response regulator CheB